MNTIKITIHIELLKYKDAIRHIDKSLAAGHISQDDAHCLKNGLAGVYASHIAKLVWYVSTTLAQFGLEFREENARFMGWDQRLLYDSQVLGRVKGRFALRP